MALIEQLKNEHALLADVLNKVRDMGIVTKEGHDLLVEAKQGLLNHLALEDRELYPVLRKGAEKSPALAHTMEVFARDMEGITAVALGFFSKYEASGSGLEFAKDIGRLLGALQNRIAKEETILFEEYRKLQA